MRIVFFGASELGYECCDALLKDGHEIVGIFTIKQEFRISYSPDKPVRNYLFKDFKQFETVYHIPVIIIDGDLKNYFSVLESLRPDFILAIGWYYLIPNKMIALARFGGAGIHGSLLPAYRGNAPFVWAMINGESKTGVTFFYFADEVDAGDIIASEEIPIAEHDTIRDLLNKAEVASIKLLREFVPRIAAGTAPRLAQDHSKATVYPKRSPEDGEINWNWDAVRIKNFIRAQTKPYPGAFFIINGKKVTLWDADIENLTDTQ